MRRRWVLWSAAALSGLVVLAALVLGLAPGFNDAGPNASSRWGSPRDLGLVGIEVSGELNATSLGTTAWGVVASEDRFEVLEGSEVLVVHGGVPDATDLAVLVQSENESFLVLTRGDSSLVALMTSEVASGESEVRVIARPDSMTFTQQAWGYPATDACRLQAGDGSPTRYVVWPLDVGEEVAVRVTGPGDECPRGQLQVRYHGPFDVEPSPGTSGRA